jgi:hypothetical protein
VPCAGPPRHVAADLTEQGQRVFLYAWNLTDIYSEEFIGFGTVPWKPRDIASTIQSL